MLLWDSKNKKEIDIPVEHVQEALATGQYWVPKEDIRVISSDGATGVVKSNAIMEAFKRGFKIETPEQKLKREQENTGVWEGVVKGAGATAAGVARGATAGVSDVALSDPGFPFGASTEAVMEDPEGDAEARRKYLAEAREQYPISSTIGELGGIAASLVHPGGYAKGAAQLGGLAAKGVTKLTAKKGAGLARKILLEKGAPLAARGAAEGPIYGVSQVISEEALAGEDGIPITAERLLAGAGTGALWGGVAGPVFGAGLHAVKAIDPRQGAKTLVSMYEKGTGNKAAPGLFKRAYAWLKDAKATAVSKGQAFATGLDEKILKKFNTSVGARARVAGSGAKSTREEIIDDLGDEWTKMIDDVDIVTAESRGTMKLGKMAPMVDESLPNHAIETTTKQLDDAIYQLETISKAPESYGKLSALTRKEGLLPALRGYRSELETLIKNPNTKNISARSFDILDRAKIRMGNTARKLRRVRAPTEQEMATSRIVSGDYEVAGGLYKQIQEALEQRSVWGKAADAQTAINKKYNQWLSLESHAHARRFSMQVGQKPGGSWAPKFGANREGFTSFANRLRDSSRDESFKYLSNTARAKQELLTEMNNWYALSSKGVKAAKASTETAGRFRKALDRVEVDVLEQNQWSDIVGASNDLKGRIGGGALGYLAGGPFGAAIGALVGGITNPAGAIRRMHAFDKIIGEFQKRFGIGIDRYVSKIKGLPIPKVKMPHGVGNYSRKLTTPGTISWLFNSSFEAEKEKATDRKEGFKRRVAELQRLASDPERMAGRLARELGETHDVAPQMAAELSMRATEAVNYLVEQIPSVPTSDELNPMLALEQWEFSDIQIDTFEKALAAIDDPLSILDSLVEGTLTPEGMEALTAVFPKLAEQIKTGVMEKLSELDTPIPYEAKAQLCILFDVCADSTFTPDFIRTMQGNFAQPEPEGPQGPKMGSVSTTNRSKSLESTSERLAEA